MRASAGISTVRRPCIRVPASAPFQTNATVSPDVSEPSISSERVCEWV